MTPQCALGVQYIQALLAVAWPWASCRRRCRAAPKARALEPHHRGGAAKGLAGGLLHARLSGGKGTARLLKEKVKSLSGNQG